MSVSKTYCAQIQGIQAIIVTVEVDISNGLHAFSVVGLGDKSIEESKDRISAAIKNSGYTSPKHKNQKVVISLAPACIKKGGSSFDLAMAIAYLKTAGDISFDSEKIIFLGELSLDGGISPVSGILAMIETAKKQGFEKIYIPQGNEYEAQLLCEKISIIPVRNLKEVTFDLEKKRMIHQIEKGLIQINPPNKKEYDNFSKIYGQEEAKRALEIAAAGNHNVLFYGPPGTGKTTLARTLVSILPDLSPQETVEVTNIYSISRTSLSGIITIPPFRAPHHSSSCAALLGGGNGLQPGEITLAHRGVLFMDEFPEFDKNIINSLRQPLEEGVIRISRAQGSIAYPARCILIAAMNPCPCGYFGSESTSNVCVCTKNEKLKYKKKISGPIADRIDIWIPLTKVDYEKNTNDKDLESSAVIKKRVLEAKMFGTTHKKDKNYLVLPKCVQDILITYAKKQNISYRAYFKTIVIARSIANLAKSTEIRKEHLLEALQYRRRDF